MSYRKELGVINYHADDDTGMYEIGEVDGGWHPGLLEDYIRSYGVNGLLQKLARMTAAVIETQRKINAEKLQAFCEEQNND